MTGATTAKDNTMKLLHIDASVRTEGSSSRRLSAFFVDKLRDHGIPLVVDRLDLAATPPRHFGPVQTAAMYLPVEEHTPEMNGALDESDALATRVLAADAIVCGVPIYNFGMPSAFKAFIDNISRSGITFQYSETGLVGNLSGKHMAFLISAGGNYRPGAMFDGLDCLTPHIKAIMGFLGVSAPDIIHAYPTLFEGPEIKNKMIAEAEARAADVAQRWAAEAAA